MSCEDEAEKQATEIHQVIVVMVPFPAQGHLNQLLHLSRLISSYNVPVHYVSTAIHSRQAKLRLQGWNPLSSPNMMMIKFHEFPVPAFPSPPPKPQTAVEFPSHLLPSFYSVLHLRQPVAKLLSVLSLTTKRLVIIYDAVPSIIQDAVTIPNGEAYSFQPLSAFRISSYVWETMGRPRGIDDQIAKQVPSRASTLTPQVMEFIKTQEEHNKYSSGALFNTCRAIEAPFLDVIAKVNSKQWAIGPFNPMEVCKNSRHKCLEWLDKQVPNSVIYVSFGSTTTLSDEQIESLAVGLENSGQKFLWVLRDADRADIFVGDGRARKLPKDYEERIQLNGQGIIVRDWAPQLEILAHASTGGFMSHCGWNSCLESITMGVPLATWPMHSDQPHNALLVTVVLKVGVVVRDWMHRDDLVESSAIENAVKKLMTSGEGEEVRTRMLELCKAVKISVAEGGDSRRDIDDFIAHIRR
ncbi:Glycosyltransferase [Heracleum sosnowskyi]|uniref:Glycosyltransferase n=1 Tax=Heracleum sosnowskyi TaxID=360622 RepID=A0AAD8MC88_9APIA|nr:Glycosyltransferase [Heracleum sosnowskyi]